MPRPPRTFEPGGFYHLASRAVAEEPLFVTRQDRITFLRLFADAAQSYEWECLSYCLMTTHYHLLVRIEHANVSRGMQQLNGEYARIFNSRHGARGHRFFRRFGSVHVQGEAHLLDTARYIALNPVVAGLVPDPALWPWSSYAATIGLVPKPSFVRDAELLRLFSDRPERAIRKFRAFVEDGMTP